MTHRLGSHRASCLVGAVWKAVVVYVSYDSFSKASLASLYAVDKARRAEQRSTVVKTYLFSQGMSQLVAPVVTLFLNS